MPPDANMQDSFVCIYTWSRTARSLDICIVQFHKIMLLWDNFMKSLFFKVAVIFSQLSSVLKDTIWSLFSITCDCLTSPFWSIKWYRKWSWFVFLTLLMGLNTVYALYAIFSMKCLLMNFTYFSTGTLDLYWFCSRGVFMYLFLVLIVDYICAKYLFPFCDLYFHFNLLRLMGFVTCLRHAFLSRDQKYIQAGHGGACL